MTKRLHVSWSTLASLPIVSYAPSAILKAARPWDEAYYTLICGFTTLNEKHFIVKSFVSLLYTKLILLSFYCILWCNVTRQLDCDVISPLRPTKIKFCGQRSKNEMPRPFPSPGSAEKETMKRKRAAVYLVIL